MLSIADIESTLGGTLESANTKMRERLDWHSARHPAHEPARRLVTRSATQSTFTPKVLVLYCNAKHLYTYSANTAMQSTTVLLVRL